MNLKISYAMFFFVWGGIAGCDDVATDPTEKPNRAKIELQPTVQEPDQHVMQALPPTKQIVFAHKSGTITETGNLSGHESNITYSVSVSADRKLSVKQVNVEDNQYITLRIFNPAGENISDMSASCNSYLKVSPTIKGTYRIEVSQCLKADEWIGSYALEFNAE